jgi:hypothetical protein
MRRCHGARNLRVSIIIKRINREKERKCVAAVVPEISGFPLLLRE